MGARGQATDGVNPIIYIITRWTRLLAGRRHGDRTKLRHLIAQYATNMVTGYQTAPWNIGARGEVMRQYTSNGSPSGWSGRLDLNKFRGDRAAWRYANPDDKGAADLASVAETSAHDRPDCRPERLGRAHHPRRLWQRSGPQAGVGVAITRRSCRSSTVASAEVPGERPPRSRSVVVRSGDTMSAIAARTDSSRCPPGVYRAVTSIGSIGADCHLWRRVRVHRFERGRRPCGPFRRKPVEHLRPGWQSAAARNGTQPIRYLSRTVPALNLPSPQLCRVGRLPQCLRR